MPRTLEGLIGATAFMAGSIAVYGLADWIDGGKDVNRAGYFDIHGYDNHPGTYLSQCKHCGKQMQIPADVEIPVLGVLCSRECELANAEHYGDDYE